MLNNYSQLIFHLLLISTLSSCVAHRQLVNFSDGSIPLNKPELISNQIVQLIQPEDLLYITVHSFDAEAVKPFNTESGLTNIQSGGDNSSLDLFLGYRVEEDGTIDFPVIGKIPVAGESIADAKEKLLAEIRPYLKDAVVNMRFLNFKIVIMGEVNVPNAYRITNNRITILEAIGMAGDFTPYANRNNVLVIRERNGVREFGRLDLQSSNVFLSPFFYLSQNDVIYVEPIQAKTATVADPFTRYISYTSAGLSLITLIIALLK